jgi:hypothetical protein
VQIFDFCDFSRILEMRITLPGPNLRISSATYRLCSVDLSTRLKSVSSFSLKNVEISKKIDHRYKVSLTDVGFTLYRGHKSKILSQQFVLNCTSFGYFHLFDTYIEM